MKRCMGLDIGNKTIGVAVSDMLKITAQGLTTIKRESLEKDFEALLKIIKDYNVDTVVSGMPKNMNGTIGPQGEIVKTFMEKFSRKIDLEKIKIEFWDERLTTVAAQRCLIEADVSRKKRKQVVDKLAAVLILQGYLDSKSFKI